jgi:putative addiction module component (TIGR02574 family)
LGRVEEVLKNLRSQYEGEQFCFIKFDLIIYQMSHLSEILKLPLAERILAVEAIWDSIAAENKNYPLTEDELQVLEERWEEYKKNPAGAKTWEDAKANILKKL